MGGFEQENAAMREYFESLPINVKNQILESTAHISTLGELKLCAEHFLAGASDSGRGTVERPGKQ